MFFYFSIINFPPLRGLGCIFWRKKNIYILKKNIYIIFIFSLYFFFPFKVGKVGRGGEIGEIIIVKKKNHSKFRMKIKIPPFCTTLPLAHSGSSIKGSSIVSAISKCCLSFFKSNILTFCLCILTHVTLPGISLLRIPTDV